MDNDEHQHHQFFLRKWTWFTWKWIPGRGDSFLHHSGNICVYLFCNQIQEESQMFQVRTSKLFIFWRFESHINEATSGFFSWTGSGSTFWLRPQLFLPLKRVALQENLEENVNIYSPVSVRGPTFLPKTLEKMNQWWTHFWYFVRNGCVAETPDRICSRIWNELRRTPVPVFSLKGSRKKTHNNTCFVCFSPSPNLQV